ncbi:MAG: nitroreductase family protein [Prevotella sp.]|jgi:nitroreductase|nr:nitroreductase family protein [Prevotella sp.]
MNLKELLQKRYSVRAYLPVRVEQEKLDYLIECVRLAPSACNIQPWTLYIVESDEKKEAVRKAYNREWFKTAPLYIVVCGDHARSWKRSAAEGKDHCDIDAAIVSEHICLAAEEIGLGTCWVCNFDPELLKSALNLSEQQEPIALFPIGYIDRANSFAPEKQRKSVAEIIKRV